MKTFKIATDKEAKDRLGPIPKQDRAIQASPSDPNEPFDPQETLPLPEQFRFDPESISNNLYKIDIH
jgi:hypothetical protein